MKPRRYGQWVEVATWDEAELAEDRESAAETASVCPPLRTVIVERRGRWFLDTVGKPMVGRIPVRRATDGEQ